MDRLHFTGAAVSRVDHPTTKHATNAAETSQRDGLVKVGEVRHNRAGPQLTDAEREAAIERAARAIERHMAAVHEANNRVPHVFSDFADASASRWMANELRKRMEMLIAGRSQAQIAKMERERGLDRPSCANEGRVA